MDNKQLFEEIVCLKDRINDLNERLSYIMEQLNNQRAADIDYIAMESGIDLDQDEEGEV